tara:strand:+ start:12075 stop:12941 length:867 start_codon:yes stop_codon:yes gene_type:complete
LIYKHKIIITSEINNLIEKSLSEDLFIGDITTESLIPISNIGKAIIIAKSDGILAGTDIFIEIFRKVNPNIKINKLINEAKEFYKHNIIFEISGSIASILQAERTALNFLQRISGIATTTNLFCKKIEPYKAKIIDTRKTVPGLRELDKYGVRIGGGLNHRFSLGDGILIKDTHINIMRNQGLKLRDIIKKTKMNISHNNKIEIEVETLEDLKEAIDAKVDTVMLDNMSIKDMYKAVEICQGKVLLEASGGVNLDNVKDIAKTGVDLISVGEITHSVKTVDLSLKFTG